MVTIVEPEPAFAATLTPESDSLYEVVNGQRVELPPMGAFPSLVASILARHLAPFDHDQRLGRVVLQMLFLIDGEANLQRRPDVALVSYDRWPRTRRVPDDDAWMVIPDLAVEVVSRTDRAEDLLEKIEEYFCVGVRLVWAVYPRRRAVHVFESFTRIGVLAGDDALDGGAVVPGFRLPLATFFEIEAGDPAEPADS